MEADYDVIMPDARGHGKSSAPPHGYLYSDLANDVIGLIEELGLSQPVLLGHSMGGMTAAAAARQLGICIRAVILADPTFISPDRQREAFESNVLEQHVRLLKSPKDTLLADLRLRHPHRSSELLEYMADARLATKVSAFEILTPPNPDYRELVSHILVPLLLVTGDKGVVSIDAAQELRALNQRLRHEQIPEAGHGLPYDQPERLAAAVQLFLRSIIPSRK
jgi:pimeloyl-ACP methyl ester carboxylesterase